MSKRPKIISTHPRNAGLATVKEICRTNGNPQPKLKLDLSFGELPPGWQFTRPTGFDPLVYPWTFLQPWSIRENGPLERATVADASVEEAHSAYLLNRIPGESRGKFMDELWRVLIPGGKATFIVPYWSSPRAIQDPFGAWPPLSEQSFLYFNKQFRENNRLNYAMRCDFDFTYGFVWDQETSLKSDDVRPFWLKHYLGAAQDLQIVLTKRA